MKDGPDEIEAGSSSQQRRNPGQISISLHSAPRGCRNGDAGIMPGLKNALWCRIKCSCFEPERADSGLVFRDVGTHDAPVTLELPIVIRAMGEPLGNARLRVYLTAGHRDARLFAIGDDFFQTELTAVAQNGDKGEEHRDLP